MAARRLRADEAALWRRIAATVTPIEGRAIAQAAEVASIQDSVPASRRRKVEGHVPELRPVPPRAAKPRPMTASTLDGSWDKALARGLAPTDRTIDLHGHSLTSAHALLDAELERAVRRGDRVILLVTGRPPRPESQRPHARGAIRAAISDWLASSRHAHAIAAVRGAHPRHGGAGALYVVLRRAR